MKLDFRIFKKSTIRDIPNLPGIYVFVNKKKEPIYVGKSVNLKSRITSYTLQNLTPKTGAMVANASYIAVIKVQSEFESLLLEAKLIKKLNPRFNISLKDDKSPLYIVITKETYPRVMAMRKTQLRNTDENYGPFMSAAVVRRLLKDLRKIFPYSQHKLGKRACIYNQFGLCSPCPNVINQMDKNDLKKARLIYLKNIIFIRRILKGNSKVLIREFEKKLQKLSQEENFEEAIRYKNIIDRLKYVTRPYIEEARYMENPNLVEDIGKYQGKALNQILSGFGYFVEKLETIECFDISHTGGTHTAASLVSFRNGVSDKSGYRRFMIRGKQGSDDIESLREVAVRRSRHLGDWGKPGLIIVDGGKGQVSSFYPIFNPIGIPTVGIAKKFETLVIPIKGLDGKKIDHFGEIKLEGPALLLVQKIRNEAHRFANAYRKKMLSRMLTG